ncbi:hypothetical protein LXL04_021272 [Taraxacum kok-saghyz]
MQNRHHQIGKQMEKFKSCESHSDSPQGDFTLSQLATPKFWDSHNVSIFCCSSLWLFSRLFRLRRGAEEEELEGFPKMLSDEAYKSENIVDETGYRCFRGKKFSKLKLFLSSKHHDSRTIEWSSNIEY